MTKLFFEFGCVGSQKTAHLLGSAFNFEEHGGRVLVLKPGEGTDDLELRSALGIWRMADLLVAHEVDVAAEVLRMQKARGHFSAVLVDNAHAFTMNQVGQLEDLVTEHKIPVMAWGLRTDFTKALFPGAAALFAVANEVRQAYTMCGHGGGCEHRAVFNGRMIDGQFDALTDSALIDVAAKVAFVALCGPHYDQDMGRPTAV